MAHSDLFERHPLCVCAPITFSQKVKGQVTIEGCRMHALTIYGIDPHPILDIEDIKAIMVTFRERMGVK